VKVNNNLLAVRAELSLILAPLAVAGRRSLMDSGRSTFRRSRITSYSLSLTSFM
jgi:hypothetical protein